MKTNNSKYTTTKIMKCFHVTFLSGKFINVISVIFNMSSSHVNTKLSITRFLSLHAKFLISQYSPIAHILSHM